MSISKIRTRFRLDQLFHVLIILSVFTMSSCMPNITADSELIAIYRKNSSAMAACSTQLSSNLWSFDINPTSIRLYPESSSGSPEGLEYRAKCGRWGAALQEFGIRRIKGATSAPNMVFFVAQESRGIEKGICYCTDATAISQLHGKIFRRLDDLPRHPGDQMFVSIDANWYLYRIDYD